jgi:hypothetical protein
MTEYVAPTRGLQLIHQPTNLVRSGFNRTEADSSSTNLARDSYDDVVAGSSFYKIFTGVLLLQA